MYVRTSHNKRYAFRRTVRAAPDSEHGTLSASGGQRSGQNTRVIESLKSYRKEQTMKHKNHKDVLIDFLNSYNECWYNEWKIIHTHCSFQQEK